MNRSPFLPVLACAVVLLSACKRGAEPAAAPAAPSVSAPSPAAPATTAAAAPAAAATAAAASAGAPFDLNAIPVSQATLPPFPYFSWPDKLNPAQRRIKVEQEFDAGYVVAGNTLRTVEGRVAVHEFFNSDAKLSRIGAWRNYENLIKQLGAVKISTVEPKDDAFVKANGGNAYELHRTKLRAADTDFNYSAYVIRTPEKNVWIGLSGGDSYTTVTVIDEKAMEQSVALVSAEAMAASLNKAGHIALSMNFDTDKSTLRPDAQPVVAEIEKLLKRDPSLKLSIEGHTDNSGAAQRNKALSAERAAAVVQALVTSGIAKDRLQSAGFGADKPVADNGSEDGRARNRRVELVKL